MNVLVSSCFLLPTRYDGKAQDKPQMLEIINLLQDFGLTIIPICPEQLGGLPTPREPAEIIGDKVVTKTKEDVTSNFQLGANSSLQIAKVTAVKFAILKENSPSCGSTKIYDGNHNHTLIKGRGLTTKLLEKNGIKVFSENDIKEIKDYICKLKI